jgi:hypothetical protein
VTADSSDRDGDSKDDLVLRFATAAATPPFEPGGEVRGQMRWFDRPAGMARDPAEPEASLRALAVQAAAKAAKAKDAPAVYGLYRGGRVLFSALCKEGGAPRLLNVQGVGPVDCGPSKALEDLTLATARSFVMLGDPLRAAALVARIEQSPGAKPKGRLAEGLVVVGIGAPQVQASGVREVSAVPLAEKGTAPAWGPLAFEASGKLLVKTAAGVVRVDPVQGDESAAVDVAPWKAAVVSPDDSMRWVDVYDTCSGPLRATFAPAGDKDPADVALPVLGKLGQTCAGKRAETLLATPVAWSSRGLEAIVAGEPILVASDFTKASALAQFGAGDVPRGSPRSPNGAFVVVPSPVGLLVRGAKTRLYRAKELESSYGDLRSCVVDDGGAMVACVRGGRVVVGTWPVP